MAEHAKDTELLVSMSLDGSADAVERVKAIVRLVCALATSGAALFSVAVDADVLYSVLIVIVSVAALVWSWWKNNNMTKAAQLMQQFLDDLKAGDKHDQ